MANLDKQKEILARIKEKNRKIQELKDASKKSASQIIEDFSLPREVEIPEKVFQYFKQREDITDATDHITSIIGELIE